MAFPATVSGYFPLNRSFFEWTTYITRKNLNKMNPINRPKLLPFIGRFTLLHLVIYFSVGYVFLFFQDLLPASGRFALDLYEPFRALGSMAVSGQILRGLAFALVFYPFYNVIFENVRGRIIMFGAMWGVALFGSVEPQPGSIEGIIYTTISFTEHLYVLLAVAAQMLLFVWLFFKWETFSQKRSGPSELEITKGLESPDNPKIPVYTPEKIRGYTIRFGIVHLVTYWVIGSLYYQIAGYADALQEMEIFEMWRDLESISAVLLVFFGQIFRGPVLALLLFPFYGIYINKKHGWMLLFLLMFGLTALGSPLFLSEFILFEGTFIEFLKELFIGIPEIVTQMLVFSLIFFWWQRKSERKK